MLNLDAEVLTWQGRTSGSGWPTLAREALTPGLEAFSFEVEEGVGIAGSIHIRPKDAEAPFTVAVDALGRTRGVLTHQGEHTAVIVIAVAVLSKRLPFDMATPKGELIDAKMLGKSNFWADLGFSYENIADLAYQMHLIPNPKLRLVAGAAAFF